MTKILEAVHRCLEKFVSLVHDFAAVITGLFILICFLQVTLRYVFNSPIYGADEIVVALMIWSMALGFTVLYWNNEHAVIEFLLRKLPRFFTVIVYNITNIGILTCSYIFFSGGITLFQLQVTTKPRMGLPFPKAYYYALPMAVMGALMLLLCGFRTVEYLITRNNNLMKSTLPEEGVESVD